MALAFCLASVAAYAEQVVREAEFALETCDTTRGLALLQALAERGDAVAQRQFGGALLPTDPAAAERWFKMAFETRKRLAESGDLESLDWVAKALNFGWGTAIDEAAGRDWARRAQKARLEQAEAGDVEAQYLLAAHYGRLIGSNYATIRKSQVAWTRVFPAIQTAAESGNMRAQERLAKMYLYGRGVPQDKAEAESWYRIVVATLTRAAQKGELGAMLRLDDMVTQDKPGSAAARRWHDIIDAKYRAAAVQGCMPAQAMVALRLQQRDYPRKPDRRARLQASVWWTILVRNTDPQHVMWVNLARDCLAANKLDADEQALVQAKAARCLQSNYTACD
ncbi:MAG: tetratricopeptide repeat protein [Reyranellaceae bacterium]